MKDRWDEGQVGCTDGTRRNSKRVRDRTRPVMWIQISKMGECKSGPGGNLF